MGDLCSIIVSFPYHKYQRYCILASQKVRFSMCPAVILIGSFCKQGSRETHSIATHMQYLWWCANHEKTSLLLFTSKVFVDQTLSVHFELIVVEAKCNLEGKIKGKMRPLVKNNILKRKREFQ